jgi:hypothetical protein
MSQSAMSTAESANVAMPPRPTQYVLFHSVCQMPSTSVASRPRIFGAISSSRQVAMVAEPPLMTCR